jgi:hypothetical protein
MSTMFHPRGALSSTTAAVTVLALSFGVARENPDVFFD